MSEPNNELRDPQPSGDKWISYEEAAARIGASRGAIVTLIRRGAIEAVKLSPRLLRVSERSLERYIQQKRAEQKQPA